MATITIVVSDTPDGAVSIKCESIPPIPTRDEDSDKVTPAQVMALDAVLIMTEHGRVTDAKVTP